ncbi:MAG TPA: bifunctional serine/threonine-protein kinase/formylglycine-generating enzyme family protein [Rhodanobacteraceae bacterium]|nr:bifunctional serine/threonine-protein kinase/formylglycine-generating enzyme family protein [Rhodanobacteraceae bacterium]
MVRPVGGSGVATVYVAMQRSLERQVAVKVFDPVDIDAIARFEQLLRTSARLSHPRIVGIHQIGRSADGRLFHSMPFLLSAELSRHNLRARPLKVATLLREVLDALGYAHRRGIVHGGIKPSNVLFDERGQAQLADFGVARCAAELDLPHPQAAAYLSPEQARGNPPGQRSDLYSVGVTAYRLLTGSLPYEGEDAVATAIAHVEQPIPRLPPRVGAWQGWIDKALAKAPEQRFQSVQEMTEALQAIDGQRRSGTPQRSVRLRLPGWTIAGAAALLAALVAVAGWAAWARLRVPVAPPGPTSVTIAAAHPAPGTSTPTQPAQPAPAVSAVALRTERIQGLIANADTLRAGGHLFSPSSGNAAEQYLAALLLDPGNPHAVAGIDAMLATLRDRLQRSWRAGDLTQAKTLLQRCDLLALHASPAATRRWRAQRGDLAETVGAAVARAAHDHDPERLDTLQALAEALPATYPAGLDWATAERIAAIPAAGERLHDAGGPLLVYVPAAGKAPAFAIARVEVTRADYARFVQATNHSSAHCRIAYHPFSRLRGLSWRAPGFTQTGDHPVVCVSWKDATAYAAWLSKTTGEPYRLPSGGEWLRAAQGVPKDGPCQLGNIDDASRHGVMDSDRLACSDGAAQTAPVGRYAASGVGAYDLYGNVSEWLAGGGAGERVFRGMSWRDGSKQSPLDREGTADSDIGYTNVGFRVLRVIDAAHPVPRAGSGA